MRTIESFTNKVCAAITAAICSLAVAGAASVTAPALKVDTSWPKPLPNGWLIGAVSGTALGPQDHIWVLHRPKALGDGQKSAAPPVIEFDAQGTVVRAWGGPGAGYEWPTQEHGLFVDYKNNVWVSGVAGQDYGRILKFTSDGEFLMSIGKPLEPGEKFRNTSTTHLGRQPADMFVDPRSNELYVADGDGGAQRVIVFDADTGAFKRIWGAYGERPTDGPPAKYDPNAPVSKSFLSGVHCVVIAHDNLVYVCDRNADRIQVFRKNGKFVKEAFVERSTLGNGSTFDIDFTPDQKQLYIADGSNDKVWILQKDTLEVISSFGGSGEGPGQFRNVHSVTVDSKGNLYTGEVNGKRVQRFVPAGSSSRQSSN